MPKIIDNENGERERERERGAGDLSNPQIDRRPMLLTGFIGYLRVTCPVNDGVDR